MPARPPSLVITLEDIPETKQVRRPVFEERSELPMSPKGALVVEEVAESNLLDSLANLDLQPKLSELDITLDEETVEFRAVSKEPRLIGEVLANYPQLARDAGMEGVVFVKFAVGSNGTVKKAQVLRGPELFHHSAIEAVSRFEFIPAVQNDRPVAVWMTLPIRFQLLDTDLKVGKRSRLKVKY